MIPREFGGIEGADEAVAADDDLVGDAGYVDIVLIGHHSENCGVVCVRDIAGDEVESVGLGE